MVTTTGTALALIMLLGDSIRMGYQNVAIRELATVANVWKPDENCAHTKHTLARIDTWLKDVKPDIIHINCGLHDMWRNADGSIRHSEALYRENLGRIFTKLKALAPQATIVFALTTPVDQDRQITSNYGRIVRYNTDIPKYNAIAREVAKEHGVQIDDLYAVVDTAGTDKLIGADGVHFNAAGNNVLGKAVAKYLKDILAAGK
ncbi:MAG: hypothetical protein HN742_33505 [Lentisphaerae bacterium]|jgi:isoamyl acetate esterase|nr:hypothetical protein [Lentisphaerota bacterium]MBT4818240.1 hypothetical protein [Lentisphaerota bacterium]MBT5611282.1 hypothetical protein [Lentisphaerota bacterium]MBT7058401.1 hypothetical protein [Lentisphaerota bacterium]MBT7846836.1 hypothetical protein [Lentisphaerota bacterium]